MPEKKRPVPPPSGPQPGRWVLGHGEIRTIVFGLMLAMFLAALNQTIVATALPTIGRDFGDFELLPWVVTAYLLTSTVVSPLYGKLSDIHGRRAMMLASIGIFVAGSAACAVAPDMITLILARGLQGIGGGGILPLAQTILGDAAAPRERGRYQAYMGSVWVTAGLAGPVLGGMLAEHFHWSIIFWINVPVGLVAAVMAHKTLRRLPRHERKHKLDLLGAGLMTAAAIPLLLALTWGGARYPWLSPHDRRAGRGLGRAVAAVRMAVDAGAEPFLPLPVLANPVMRMGTVCTSFSQAVVIGLTIFLPLYFEVVHKFSASDAGLALIPIIVMSTPGSIVSGRAMMHIDHYKRVPIICLLCSIAALSLLVWKPAMPPIAVVGRAQRGRFRHRHHLSGRHRFDPERGLALSGRRRHGSHELLSWADRGIHRGGHGRDRARRARRFDRTRRPRHRVTAAAPPASIWRMCSAGYSRSACCAWS